MKRDNPQFLEDRVIKRYKNRERFLNEIRMRSLFEPNFRIPKILQINEEENIIEFEVIRDGVPLNKILGKLKLDDITELLGKIPRIKGRRSRKDQKVYVVSTIDDVEIKYFIKNLTLDGDYLIHGDLRPQNILKTEDLTYLVDFESSDYSDKEKDSAYFYMELINFNPSLGNDFLDYTKEQVSYPIFLFYCLYYTLSSLESPYSNKSGLINVKHQIFEEIKTLL